MTMTIQNERAVSRRLAQAFRKGKRGPSTAGADASVAHAAALHGGLDGIGSHVGFAMATQYARSQSLAAGGDP